MFPRHKLPFSRRWRIAAAFALIALCGTAVWFLFFRAGHDDNVLDSLNRAYRSGRPFAARVSGLAYAPFRGSDTKVDQNVLEAAENRAGEAVSRQPSAQNLHNEGRVFLMEAKFDRALESLERAARQEPANAALLNDIGVAQLESSRAAAAQTDGASLELKAKALENFEQAVKLDQSLTAARFNRALCVQSLLLLNQTEEAWRAYLAADPASAWSNDAKDNQNLARTTRLAGKDAEGVLQEFLTAYRAGSPDGAYQIISSNREMISGKVISERLVYEFLKRSGDERQQYLAALRYAGELEAARSQDPYFVELARFYSSIDPARTAILLQAHGSLREGYRLSLLGQDGPSLQQFEAAGKLFTQGGSVAESKYCDYWRGYTLFRLGRVAESNRILNELAEFTRVRNYPWLRAHAYAWLAVNMIADKNYSKALEFNRTAMRLATSVHDLYLNEKTNSQIADVYRRIGDNSAAITYLYRALALEADPNTSPRQRWRDQDTAADLFFAMKHYNLATVYKQESIALAAQRKDPSFASTAYVGLGVIYGALGQYDESFSAFAQSRDLADQFSNPALKLKSYAEIDLRRATVFRWAGIWDEALRLYDSALAFYETSEWKAKSYEAHKGRLLCYDATKNDAAFQSELPIILALFRDYRRAITEEQNRSAFFDNEQTVFDIAIDHEFERGNTAQAFAYSEQSRARSLLDLQSTPIAVAQTDDFPELELPQTSIAPSTLSEIQARIPPQVQLVQYSVLANKTLVWLITNEGSQVVPIAVGADRLRVVAAEYLDLVGRFNGDKDQTRTLAQTLYQLLITPVETKLDPHRQLCFIPDKILFRLPFGALVSPSSGEYLIAKRTLFISPSPSVLLNTTKQAVERGQSKAETLMSIGNPAFRQENHPELEPLPDAVKEAREIATFYDTKVDYIGPDATKARVAAGLPQANVIHFAGHYLVNKAWPLRSGLVLASEPNESDPKDSLLTNYELFATNLHKVRLIVLSACDTGVERFYNGEGMTGAARTFLAMGVPLIVASQWRVDSEATAELMIRFHRYRKLGGLSTVEALRRSQLDMLEGANANYRNPYYWAGFEVIGGYAEF